MGSIGTDRLYAIDPRQWTLIEEAKVPGKPWGMTVVGDELRVVCGVGDDDDREIRRFVPGHGFKSQGAIECPDATGSQLSYDGTLLYLSQWYNRRILGLDERGTSCVRSMCRIKSADSAIWTETFISLRPMTKRATSIFSRESPPMAPMHPTISHGSLSRLGLLLTTAQNSGRIIERRIKSSHLIAEQFASNDPRGSRPL